MFKKKQNIFSHPLVKRKTVCVLMGIGFGFLCAYLASSGMEGQDFWWTPLMWVMVINRTFIGFIIFIAGAFNYNSVLKIKTWAWMRGAVIGAVFSVGLAMGVFMNPAIDPSEAMSVFWMTIAAGAFYGLVIDAVATALFGDGKKLTEGWSK